MNIEEKRRAAMAEAAAQLSEAMSKEKCRACACFRNSLVTLENIYPKEGFTEELKTAIRAGRSQLKEVKYDCLGCEVCHPALALHALNEAGLLEGNNFGTCFADETEKREGWPPLPGDYMILHYRAPVAICTLTDEKLAKKIAQESGSEVALVGTLQTENIGIERLVWNIIANPHVRFLIVCGADSRQAVGHLPGETILALARNGLDTENKIIGTRGRRPFLHNLPSVAAEHFRRTIEIIDLVDTEDLPAVIEAAQDCARRYPGLSEVFSQEWVVQTEKGYKPEKMIPDPAGFFLVSIDRSKRVLYLEHYTNEGVLDSVIEAQKASELYFPAVEKGLVSRLDHAAYLGCELARAEKALESGEEYFQDAAPEKCISWSKPVCSCNTECKEGKR